MSRSAVDDQLFNDHVDFLKNHTVLPPNAPKHLKWGVHMKAGQWEGQQQVGNTGRIAFGTLTPSALYPGGYDLEVEYANGTNEGKLLNWVPMWFLPWNSEKLVGIQITPKVPDRPTPTTRQRANAVAAPPANMLAKDPDLFFTAAINGCSVFVTGDPKAPRVYHGGTQEEYRDPTVAVAKWQTMFREVEPQAFFGGDFSEVNKTHYVRARESKKVKELQITKSANTGGTNFRPLRDFVTDNSSQFKKYLKTAHVDSTGKSLVRVQRIMPFGCVFGKRAADGNWAFYLQESVKVIYTLASEVNGQIVLVGSNRVATRPICLSQIFPQGRHVAQYRQQFFQPLA